MAFLMNQSVRPNTAEKRLRMRQFYWDWLDESGVSSLFISQYGGEKKYLTYVPLE